MPNETTAGKEWAQIIRDGSSDEGVRWVILAVNRETAARRSNRGDVMVACAQILGQSIAEGGPEIAAEVRQGILSMIDGYTMEVAVGR